MSHMSNLCPGFWFWPKDVQRISISSSSPSQVTRSQPVPRISLISIGQKAVPNPTRKLTHTRYLGDRGKHTANETRSNIKIAGFKATGSHFGLNLNAAVVGQWPRFWQWVPAGGRKQYSDVINTLASNYRHILTLILKDCMYDLRLNRKCMEKHKDMFWNKDLP